MPTPFDASETAFTKTAGTLQNLSGPRSLSFPTWGNPERSKINEVLKAVNSMIYGGY